MIDWLLLGCVVVWFLLISVGFYLFLRGQAKLNEEGRKLYLKMREEIDNSKLVWGEEDTCLKSIELDLKREARQRYFALKDKEIKKLKIN